MANESLISHTELHASCGARKASVSAETVRQQEELKDLMRVIAGKEREAIAVLDAELAAELERRDAATMRAFHEAMAPFLRKWRRQPSRELATEIGSVFGACNAARQHATGHELDEFAIPTAFATVLVEEQPEKLEYFVRQDTLSHSISGPIGAAAAKLHNVLGGGGADVAAIFDALSKLETAMTAAPSVTYPEPHDASLRLEIWKHVGRAERANKLAALDRLRAQQVTESTGAIVQAARAEREAQGFGFKIESDARYRHDG